MPKTRSTKPPTSTNTLATYDYQSYLADETDLYELQIDGKLAPSENKNELSPDDHTGYTHIQLNPHDGANKKDKRIKSHRKKTQIDPENTMVIKQVEQHNGFSLEIPEAAQKIKSESKFQRQSLSGNYSNYQQAQTPIKPTFQIELNSFEDESPAIRINKAGRYEQTKTRKSQNLKGSKSRQSGNIVLLNLSNSIQQKRYQQQIKDKKIVAHESSNILLDGPSVKISYGYLFQPIPQGQNRQFSYKRQMLCCHSLRNPSYSLSLNGGGFMFNAKKQFGHLNSNYVISAIEDNYEKKGQSYIGHLKGNFTGSEFNLLQINEGSQQVVATIVYDSGWKCSSNFRKIQVYIKNPSFRGSFGDDVSLKELYCSVGDNNSRNIIKLVTKQPRYHKKQDVYILNFKGKSKYGSIKNMILIEPSKPNDYLLMFCKNDAHEFYLQVANPLSPLIAFGIVLSGFDFKLCSQ